MAMVSVFSCLFRTLTILSQSHGGRRFRRTVTLVPYLAPYIASHHDPGRLSDPDRCPYPIDPMVANTYLSSFRYQPRRKLRGVGRFFVWVSHGGQNSSHIAETTIHLPPGGQLSASIYQSAQSHVFDRISVPVVPACVFSHGPPGPSAIPRHVFCRYMHLHYTM